MATAPKARNAVGEYMCPDCPRTFTTPQALGRHRQALHPISSNNSGEQPQPQEELSDDPMQAALRDRLSSVNAELISVTEKREQLEREFAWLTRIQDMVNAGPDETPAPPA